MANTVDPDETAHYEPSHLDLQCLQIQLLLCLVLYGLRDKCATCTVFTECFSNGGNTLEIRPPTNSITLGKPGTIAQSVACPLHMQEAPRSTPASAHSFMENFPSSVDSRRVKLSVTGKIMGTKYWLTVSRRLALKQYG